jgi:ATP-dependent Lhr-like helicase
MLLARYGVLFRDLLLRESNAPKWRDLLGVLRRLEARGEVRGGRFVSGFGGEQFALPDAVESLRLARKDLDSVEIQVAAADPMNLAGIVVPGERVASVPGRSVTYRSGAIVLDESIRSATARTTRVVAKIFPGELPQLPKPVVELPALRLF